ncbi:MAG: dienelactone hydrolase family protein [Polaromonas sp.]
MTLWTTGLGLILALGVLQPAAAQEPAGLMANAKGYTAVKVSGEPQEGLGAMTALSNKVFKPAGAGPFPAVVLVHTCGGVLNAHIRQHAQELLAAGYVVLVQDSHGPRNFVTCREKAIPFAVGVMDAYAGLASLAALPLVDKQRIYLAGYSYGGFVAAMASSPQSASTFAAPLRFRAAVAHYANCTRPSGAQVLLRDIDRPLLMLMGERDTEALPATCFPLLEQLKAGGAPVDWFVYPGATHGWDKQGETANGYVYREETALDATRRMLAFFDTHK